MCAIDDSALPRTQGTQQEILWAARAEIQGVGTFAETIR